MKELRFDKIDFKSFTVDEQKVLFEKLGYHVETQGFQRYPTSDIGLQIKFSCRLKKLAQISHNAADAGETFLAAFSRIGNFSRLSKNLMSKQKSTHFVPLVIY